MQPDTDNLLPKGGQFFAAKDPEIQKEAEAEKAKVFNALPLIDDILAHFTERIALRDSIKSINVNIAEDPELHQKTCSVNDLVADALRDEKKLLEALIEDIQ